MAQHQNAYKAAISNKPITKYEKESSLASWACTASLQNKVLIKGIFGVRVLNYFKSK